MKIAIIGAAGNVGRRLVAEALSRRHEVTAIGRTRTRLEELANVTVRIATIGDPDALAEALAGQDAVISTVRFVDYDPQNLLSALRKAGAPRLLVVGGAGSLTSPAGGLVMDGPNFPEAALPEARAGGKMLEALRGTEDLDWSFLSPSAIFTAGARTGEFRLGQDDLLIDDGGKSHISYEDLAVAMLDEVEDGRHSRMRFTVGY
ncbi:NAD(P)-dependent oxidoreductase [Pseudodonghicola flavimaris]|uniref:NAD(P)-dependent oxidoreductase n=1 Tax=Pseudodonghicola flavimaris TaxID=3050036 RepID=A0ABT7F1B4_9RHOB|nr:NAD(P)-dependent oxidoreductase [Pseudodonghicola flavimaris]MDK3018393.1 NAD(P)-dependent oxidoreductase [Pseudodonghicola flavimaris]